MERRAFDTALGEVWLWGEAEAFEDHGLAIVVLTGAFASPSTLRVLADLIPETSMLFGDIPGNHCPPLVQQSVGAFCSAYGAAIEALRRPVVLCGSSLGATAALGIRSPNVRAVLALEPLMRSEAAAPLWPGFRGALIARPDDDVLADTLWRVFGVSLSRTEARNYAPVLDGLKRPARVLAGSSMTAAVPTLLSAQDRRTLKAHPMVKFNAVLRVGHDIGNGATGLIVETLRELVGAHQHDGNAAVSADAGSSAVRGAGAPAGIATVGARG